MEVDFSNIASYLPQGTSRQREACAVLARHRIMELLAAFDPLLAGTVPIRIDIPSSDLDILCRYREKECFTTLLHALFGDYEGFACHMCGDAVVAGFRADGLPVEVYGSPVPTRSQAAWRHMLIEHAILERHGDDFRRRIIDLKLAGMKTEPAFAHLLGLPGDPFLALLEYSVD